MKAKTVYKQDNIHFNYILAVFSVYFIISL